MRIALVVGNPKPNSRTMEVGRSVADWLCRHRQAELTVEIDLADHAATVFDWSDQQLNDLTGAVATSDVLIAASPTYKGTYTGLLKAFLDRYPGDGLANVTAVPIMTGGNPQHAMGIELGLRPLLVELGASVPTRGLFFQMSQIDQLDSVVDEWATTNLRSGGWFAGPNRKDGAA